MFNGGAWVLCNKPNYIERLGIHSLMDDHTAGPTYTAVMTLAPVRYRAIVSDLHFGEGLALENFACDSDFRRFLGHVAAEGRRRAGTAELILNGDVVDFLQVSPLHVGPWRDAIAKLDRVFRAHRETFDEVARFVAEGNRLVVLVGNHDIELMFGEVQRAFIAGLGLPLSDCQRVLFPNDAELDQERFRGWTRGPFVYQVDGVHIEHGNQLDPLNYFDHRKFYDDEEEGLLHTPWGSQFVLSVFNRLATEYRFLDKVRSKLAAGLILWALDPKLAHESLPGFRKLGPNWVQKLVQFHLSHGTPAGGGARAPEPPEETALALFGALAHELEVAFDHPQLQMPEGARSEPALRAKIALLKRALAECATGDMTKAEDEHTKQAFDIARQSGVHTVVLGHTHGARDLEKDGKRYLNSGTWINLVQLDSLREAVARADGDPWAVVAALLDPETFRSQPKLSYVELYDGKVNLRTWKQ